MTESSSLIVDRPQPAADALRNSVASAAGYARPRRTWREKLSGLVRPVAELTTCKSALSVFDQAVVSGTSFATSVIIGRTCSKEELGVYFLALSIVLFIRGVQEQLICAPYIIYCNHRRGDALASYGGSMLVHQLVLSLLTAACLLGLIGVLALGIGPSTLAPAAWVLLGVAPMLLLREFIRQFAFAHLKIVTAIVIDVTVAGFQLGALLLLAHLELLSAATVYLAMGGACVVACLGWFLAGRQPLRLVRSRFFADWRHNWAFGKWALASQLIGCAAPYLMPWVLVLACGEAETGVLAACAALVGLSSMFVTGVANYLTPKAAGSFARGGVAELRRVLWKTAALFVVVLGGFCLMVFVAGDLLAVLVFGDKYLGTGAVMTVLALASLIGALGLTAGNGLWAMDRPSANFAADVWSLGVTLVVVFWLVGPLGVLGVAIAELAGMAAGTVIRCLTLFRLMESARTQPGVA